MSESNTEVRVVPSVLAFVQKKPKEPTTVSLEEVFDYFSGPDGHRERQAFDLERCVRSVAFLLSYVSDMGNESIDGSVSHGLGLILQDCANRLPLALGARKVD